MKKVRRYIGKLKFVMLAAVIVAAALPYWPAAASPVVSPTGNLSFISSSETPEKEKSSGPELILTMVQIASVTVDPGLAFNKDVQVRVRNVPGTDGLGAYDIKVLFDKDNIKINGVSGGAAPFDSAPTSNADTTANTTGELLLNSFHASYPGPTGDVLIATINISAINAGVYTITPEISTLSSTLGDDVVAVVSSGTVTAYSFPVAGFSGSPVSGIAPLPVDFTDLSSGPAVSWLWDLDGNSSIDSSSQNPSFTYTNPGNYTVSLAAGNPRGADGESKTDYIRVYGVPEADFKASKTHGRAPFRVNFTDQSTGNIANWDWDLDGDGTIDSNSQNPSYIYMASGDYTVSLNVSNPAGTDNMTEVEYISVKKIKVKKFFRIIVDEDGVVVLTIDIGDMTDPFDPGVKIKPNKGIKAFKGEVNFNPAGMAVLGGRKGGPDFDDPTIEHGSGKATFRGNSNKEKKHDPEIEETRIAKLVPRLMGGKDVPFGILLNLQSITEGDDESEGEEEEPSNLTFYRGAARGGTSSNIVDALFMAQYLVGLRDISYLNPLNAASIKWDDGGDRITITDALFLAQALAALRDGNFDLIP
ncbi:PKD domain-containing protein [Chloroflexota bacterium]